MYTIIRTAIAGSVLLLGCAHAGPRTSADGQTLHSIRVVDARPELLGCARYMPARSGVDRVARVEATFTVSATGVVQDVMLGHVSPPIAAQRLPVDVREIISSCAYQPAILDGEAVGVWGASRSFHFAVNALGPDAMDVERRGRKVESGGDDDRPARPVVPPPRGN